MVITDRQMVGERPDTDGKFIFPFRATCDFENEGWGCSFDEVFYDLRAAAWATDHHEHFKTYQERRYNYLSIAESYWVELDSVIDELKAMAKDDPVTGGVEYTKALFKLQGRASGLAFALVKACHPYYADERSVSIEANRRWKMREGQLEWAPTLGFKYSPPPAGRREVDTVPSVGHDNPVRVNTARRPAKSAAENAADKLTPATKSAIKQGIESGMFKPADLSKVYGVPVDVIEALVRA